MARPRKNSSTIDTAAAIRGMALEQFGKKGFGPTSLEDIAKAVGVTRTTLLYHFESKDALYNAVVQEAFTRISTMLVSGMIGTGDFRRRLRRMVKSFLDHVEENAHLAKLMIREVVDEHGPGVRIIQEQGMPVLDMVEAFILQEGQLRADQKPLLREILLQITTSVMLKSASGELKRSFWGAKARTGELAMLLIEGLIG